jgi:8-oxo-dGTP pyrophosphatase MutT (NUDIX family)
MSRTQQVAALPWRKNQTGLEVLLVTTRTSKRWVIPKGWPMNGKSDPEAAAIEAYEEAGVQGEISATSCGHYGYSKLSDRGKMRALDVTVYPLQVKKELDEWPEQSERERRWVSLADAAKLAVEPGLFPILDSFIPVERLGLWARMKHWLHI